jgi:hypothetical protein
LTDTVKRESNLTTESIRELKHQAGAKFIDLTPVFFIIGALAIEAFVIGHSFSVFF